MNTNTTKALFLGIILIHISIRVSWSQCTVTATASDYTICIGESVDLSAVASNPNASFVWNTTSDISNLMIANPIATPLSSSTYTVTATIPMNSELIPNGNFEAGNTGFSSDYTYSSSGGINSGKYSVVTNPANQNGGWAANMTDHTTGSGNMMIIDGGAFTNVWAATVNVQSNTLYNFSAWAASMGIGSSNINIAQLMFKVNGVLIGNLYNCGDPGVWGQFTATWNSGSNTTALIEIVDQQTNSAGNDFALDDISFIEVCTATNTVIINVLENVTPIFDQISSICQGSEAPELPLVSLNIPPVIGTWSSVIDVSTSGTFTYTFLPSNPDQCALTATMDVTINAVPDVSFITDTTRGCGPLTIHFMNQTPNTTSCFWDFGIGEINTGNEQTIVYKEEGFYDVVLTVVIENGCMGSLSEDNYIYVNHNPIASFIPSNANPSTTAESIHFINTSSGASNYEWTFGDGSSSLETDPDHYFTGGNSSFDIRLVAISEDGCTDTTQAIIEFKGVLNYYVPNSFTPDGDDYNNTFQPVFPEGFDPLDYHMSIYSRWGELLYQTNSSKEGWDGIKNGEMMQDGVYTWKLEFTSSVQEGKQIAMGSLSLFR